MVSAAFPNRPFNLRDNVQLKSQDVANNRSLVTWELWIDKTATSPTFSGGKAFRWMKLDGGYVHQSYGNGFDFRNGNNFLLASGETWIGHNSDGTKNLLIEAAADYDSLGATSLSVTIGLPTIPRKSTPTFQNPGYENLVIGQNSYMVMNRADSSFVHESDYYWGNITGRAMTGVGADGNWTPPTSFLSQIPDSESGVGTLRTHTLQNGNLIGYVDQLFRAYAGPEAVPSTTGATVVEAVTTPDVASIMGAGVYVQGVSKLKGTLSGIAGYAGSTVNSVYFTAGTKSTGGTFSDSATWSGTASETVAVTGTSVPVKFTAQDTRGRATTRTVNVNVLPYSPPQLNTFTVDRANSSGAVDLNGTYLRVTLNTAVQSLVNSTQRNRHTVRIYTRVRGTTAWTLKSTPVNASTTLTFGSTVSFNGPYDVATSYEVRVEVSDQFNTTSAQATITVAKVHMHLTTSAGLPVVALGKYWEQGTLDVAGDIYSNNSVVITEAKGRTLIKPTSVSNGTIQTDGSIVWNASATSLAVNGAFPTKYSIFELEAWFVFSGSNGVPTVQFRSGGTNLGNSNNPYYTQWFNQNSTGTGSSSQNEANVSLPAISAQYHRVKMTFYNTRTTGQEKFFQFQCDSFGAGMAQRQGFGYYTGGASASPDGLTISFASGTLASTAGLSWMRIYGVA